MPAAVYFGGETVLFVQEAPQEVVSALKREANGWTPLRDVEGNQAIVFGARVCFVGPITDETLANDHVLAGKVRRLLGGS